VKHRHLAALATVTSTAVLLLILRRRYLRWGATDHEISEPLPGDDLLSSANLTATRAVSIHTSSEYVWPWIVQLGQGRGGLYSYDLLENLVGCDMHSADRILPQYQAVYVGDDFRLHPQVTLKVVRLDPGNALVVQGGVPMGTAAPPYDFTWAFVLHQRDGSTRLVIRERYRYSRWWAPFLVEPVEAVSCVMTQKMIRGIKGRAERAISQD
jgi:hypothetical protein